MFSLFLTGACLSGQAQSAPAGSPGKFFGSDLEAGSLKQIFQDVNTYGSVHVALSTDVAHSGANSLRITYPADEAGVELKPAPFPATKTLFVRKFEYFAPEWEGDWPVGLKTGRYFTRPDFSTGAEPDAFAYLSEKMLWQSYQGDAREPYGRGLCMAIFNQDIEAVYAATTLFGNGLPYIRTGHWYKIETWLALDSAVDAGDGILQIWIDDKLVLNRKDISWRSTERGVPNGGEGWQSMWFGGNYSGAIFGGPSRSLRRYMDDLHLSTTLDR